MAGHGTLHLIGRLRSASWLLRTDRSLAWKAARAAFELDCLLGGGSHWPGLSARLAGRYLLADARYWA